MKNKYFFLPQAFLMAFIITGCSSGNMSSPEGQFKGCFSHVSKMAAAVERKIKTSGNLDDIYGADDIYWLIAKSEDQYNKLVEQADMYCEDVNVEISPSSNSFAITAHPIVAPHCEITATAESVGPKSLYECQ